MNSIEYMKAALSEAELAASEGEVPVGAVIVKDGKIIATARNNREATGDATGHAELLAIREACRVLGGWHLEKCTLYVTLEPCPMCMGAIINSRLGNGKYDYVSFGDNEIPDDIDETKIEGLFENYFISFPHALRISLYRFSS